MSAIICYAGDMELGVATFADLSSGVSPEHGYEVDADTEAGSAKPQRG